MKYAIVLHVEVPDGVTPEYVKDLLGPVAPEIISCNPIAPRFLSDEDRQTLIDRLHEINADCYWDDRKSAVEECVERDLESLQGTDDQSLIEDAEYLSNERDPEYDDLAQIVARYAKPEGDTTK